MSTVFRVLAVFGVAVFLGFLLREAGFKGAKLISVVGMAVILLIALERMSELKEMLNLSIFGDTLETAAQAVMKIIGVGYIFGISSDICKEMGESGVGSCMLVAGRVEILILSLPFFEEAFLLGSELLK